MEIFNIFSVSEPFKTGASGSGLGVPYTIQYNMSVMGTELDGTRYIRNYGKGGNSFNAEALASNHIYLNGTTQSVPYPTLASVSFLTYFDSITSTLTRFGTDIDYGDGLITPSSTYSATDSHQFVFNHTAPLTDADVAAIEADPNLAFRMLFGEVLPSGFSNTDVGWFSGGNGGLASGAYVQDLGTALGTEETVNGTFDTDLIGWSFSSSISWSGGKAVFDGTEVTSTLRQGSGVIIADKIYVGTYEVSDYGSGSLRFNVGDKTIANATANGIYTLTVKATTVAGGYEIYIAGLSNFVGSADNISVREATAVEIQDYNSTCRTTLANQSNGASNLKLTRDGSGRTTGIAATNTTQWEADGRTAVTNWTITAPFTVTEPIDGDTYTFTSDGNRYKNAVADGTYTLPTGTWTLDELGFDGVTTVTARGATRMIDEVVIP